MTAAEFERLGAAIAAGILEHTASRKDARRMAIYVFEQVFSDTSGITDEQRQEVHRAIDAFHASDGSGCKPLVNKLSPEGQTEFWRSRALYQVFRLDHERHRAEAHIKFWCATVLAQATLLDRLPSRRGNRRNVIDLFPRGQP